MKILQITPERTEINSQVPFDSRADYMGDLLFHGLRELYGESVVDFPRKDHLYKGYEHGNKLWGRGFSYSALLDELDTDRTDIPSKISNGFFDLIILTSHNTVDWYEHIFYSYLDRIKDLNANVKLAVVNGKDRPETYDRVWNYTPYHFQREIPDNADNRLIPISFAIPKEKIIDKIPKKNKWIANIVPADHSHHNRKTHTYDTEQEYYKDYEDSYYALTCIKAGADCMRHYEILARGSVPIFTDIENVPQRTLMTLPKELLSSIKNNTYFNLPQKTFDKNEIKIEWQYINEDKFIYDLYEELSNFLLDYTKKYLHTEYLAKYLLEKCECL